MVLRCHQLRGIQVQHNKPTGMNSWSKEKKILGQVQ